MASLCSAMWLGHGFHGARVNLKTFSSVSASVGEVIWGHILHCFCFDRQLGHPIPCFSAQARGVNPSLQCQSECFRLCVRGSCNNGWSEAIYQCWILALQHMSHIRGSLIRNCTQHTNAITGTSHAHMHRHTRLRKYSGVQYYVEIKSAKLTVSMCVTHIANRHLG